jgi:tetratricopeptide (TPR) repeat protein
MTENKNKPTLFEESAKDFYQTGKFRQAADGFSQAAAFYLDKGEKLLVAEMRNNQSVALLKAKKPRLALEAVQGTDLVFQQAGDLLKQGMALANQATALQEMGQKQKAIDDFNRAAEIFKQNGEKEMYLQTKQSISALKMKTRNVIGALFSMQEGLDELEKPNLRQKLLRSLLRIPQNLINK